MRICLLNESLNVWFKNIPQGKYVGYVPFPGCSLRRISVSIFAMYMLAKDTAVSAVFVPIAVP